MNLVRLALFSVNVIISVGQNSYDTLWGYLQCDQSSRNKIGCVWWRHMSLLCTVQTFKDAESSVLQFTVVGRQGKG